MSAVRRVKLVLVSLLLVGCASGTPTPTPTPAGPTLSVTRADYFPTYDNRPVPTRDRSAFPTPVRPTATPAPQRYFTDPSQLPSAYVGTLPLGAKARLGQGELSLVELSPGGNYLAIGGSTGVLVYDVETLELRWAGRTPEMVRTIVWSRDEAKIAAGLFDGSIIAWDTYGGNRLFRENSRDGMILSLEWSPDGTFLAAATIDGAGLIVDGATGNTLHRLVRTDHPPTGVPGPNFQASYESHGLAGADGTLSPDGNTYATAYLIGGGDAVTADHVIILWDTHTGAQLRILDIDYQPGTISWSPDGQTIASAHYFTQQVHLINPETGEISKNFLEDNGSASYHLHAVRWSPDGSKLVNEGDDITPTIIDIETGNVFIADANRGSGYWDSESSWTADSKVVAVFNEPNKQVIVVSAENGQVLHTLANIEQGGTISRDGAFYFGWTGQSATSLGVWNTTTGILESVLITGTHALNGMSWKHGTSLIAAHVDEYSGGEGTNAALIWDAETRSPTAMLDFPGIVDWVPNTSLLSISFNPTANLFDFESWQITSHVDAEGLSTLAWSADGTRVAIGTADQWLEVRDYLTDNVIFRINADPTYRSTYPSSVTVLAWSPDGNLIASSTEYGSTLIWDTATGEESDLLQNQLDASTALSFSPDGSMLAASPGYWRETCTGAQVWHLASGALRYAFHDDDLDNTTCISSFAWSPDGKSLAVAYGVPHLGYEDLGFWFEGASPITLYNIETGERYKVLEGHTSDVTGVAFSSDGQTLISSSLDGTLIIWDLTQQ